MRQERGQLRQLVTGTLGILAVAAFAILGVGCAHPAAKPVATSASRTEVPTERKGASPEAQATSAGPVTGPSIKATFPKDKMPESPQLYQILERSKLKALKFDNITVLRAFNVECRVNVDSGGYSCTLRESPEPKARKRQIGGADAEALAMLLFGLPVAQGDTGAETRFVECMRQGPKNTMATDCSVAIDLDYQGP